MKPPLSTGTCTENECQSESENIYILHTNHHRPLENLPPPPLARKEVRRRRHHSSSSLLLRSRSATRNIKRCSAFHWIVIFVVLSCWSQEVTVVVRADWIDPATPHDVRTTTALNVKRPPIPKPNSESLPKTTAGNSTVPSSAPTASLTKAPTKSPTTSPTAFPTYNPDRVYHLVFSDEFNTAHREFYDGADPRWTAMNKNDYTNDALHYYSPANAKTNDHGELVITSQAVDTDVVGFDDVKLERTRVTKHFRSAMLQSWNKFCLTGGIIEARVTLPGSASVGGLWPAFWMLGNLARHTYVGSSEHIWPWASTNCTVRSSRAQRVSGCDTISHYSLQSHLGRGAPEIDIFEVQPGSVRANTGLFLKSSVGQPFMSSSYQVAPGRNVNRPGAGEWPGPDQWYKGLTGGRNTSLNILFYGTYNHFRDDVDPAKQDYWSDAISYNRQLNESHFTEPHTYRLEWDVPNGNESHGYLHWFLDGELVYAIDGKGLSGSGAEISSEPSYIILNTAISKQWGFPNECPANCPCKTYDCNSKRWQDWCGFSMGFCRMMQTSPPEYKIDWVRAYQDPNDPKQKVGCSTPERPTRKFIVAHEKVYKTETDAHPLKGVPNGLGSCDPHAVGVACGGRGRGRCTQGRVCECEPGWTGPHCLANAAFDSIVYDPADKLSDVGFIPPQVAPLTLFGSLGVIMVCLVMGIRFRRRLAGWQPVPDVAEKYQDDAKMHHPTHITYHAVSW